MRVRVNKFANYKGVRIHVRWMENGYYNARAATAHPLPSDFFLNMTLPGKLEYEGDIPVESDQLYFE
jgi:hypothetical protein